MTAVRSPSVLRERWTRLGAIVCVVALVLVAVLAAVGVRTLANSKAGQNASSLPPAQALPRTEAALLAVKADTGALAALVVLAKAAPGSDGKSRGGAIIPIPVGSGIQFGKNPSLSRLAELYLAGGLAALAEQAGSLLSITFSVVAELDAPAATQLLTPAGTVTIRQSAGNQPFGPAAAATMLATQSGRLEGPHFASTVAYWTGLAQRVGKGLSFSGSQTTGAITRFFDSILAGPISVYPINGSKVPQGDANPNNSDVYRLDRAELDRVLGLVLSNTFSPVDAQFTARVVNPTGDPEVTLAAIRKIRAAGGAVTIVDETKGELPAQTEFSLTGRLERADVKLFATEFGLTTFVSVAEPGERHMRYVDIDLTVVIGAGFKQTGASK
ncbi:MAG: hypothetical protein WCH93_08615 [Actinomycetota bacterium]